MIWISENLSTIVICVLVGDCNRNCYVNDKKQEKREVFLR